jgi:hypothetical protein
MVLLLLFIGSSVAGFLSGKWGVGLGLAFASFLMAGPVASWVRGAGVKAQGGAESVARKRVEDFVAKNPHWNVRVYRTPAGLRLLATHQPFEPDEAAVQDFFKAVSADPVYVRMCKNQRCFRARLTAKPWRIGIMEHMRPRGVWPVKQDQMPIRQAWVKDYEARAEGYAACRYEDSLGSGDIHDAVRPVMDLHDRLCRSMDGYTELA